MAPDTPRAVSSNPNLAESRKPNLQGLNLNAAASSSNESLATPIVLSSPRMATTQTSVLARAKAFETISSSRAQAGRGAGTFSPATSPPPISPFVKSIGARILIPQSTIVTRQNGGNNGTQATRPATQPNTPVAESTSQSQNQKDLEEADRGDSPKRTTVSSIASVSAESLPATLASRKPSLVPTEGSSEEDRTPRQSTTFPNTAPQAPQVPQVSRMDSSRQTNYSLKARTYTPSPEPEQEQRVPGQRAEPPRLPKLFFEGSLTDNGEHPALPSARTIRSPYSSPNTELARAGWDTKDAAATHKHGESLTVPNNPHAGQAVESPPPDDLDASNRSFFWHSSNDTDETDDDADVEDNPGGFPSLPRRSDTSMTSANVFGPGGPSDWEHFYVGDYDTEMVDDTELYLTDKERDRLKREELERSKAAVIARRNSENDENAAAEATQGHEENKTDEGTSSRAYTEPQLPTIQESPTTEGPEDDQIRRTDVDYNPETDVLDGFARSPAPATPAVFLDRPNDTRESIESKITQRGSKETIRNVAIALEEEKPEEEPASAPATADKEPDQIVEPAKSPAEPQETEEDKPRPDSEVEPAGQQTKESVTPPPQIRLPHGSVNSIDTARSGPSSPPIDDPNAGHITVSMVLPADFDPTSSPERTRINVPRSSNMHAGARRSIFPQADELPNPYSGLSTMAKASLNRFVRMLQEEEKVSSDQEKFSVFLGFAQHETKLRATLYDMDDEELSLPPSKRASVRSSLNKKLGALGGRSQQPSLRSKPLPAAPGSSAGFDPTLGRNQSIGVSAAGRAALTGPPHPPPTRSPPPAPGSSADKSTKSSDESFVMVDTPGQKSDTTSASTEPKGSAEGLKKASLETLNKSIDLVAPRTSIMSDPSIAETNASSEKSGSERQSVAGSPLPGAQILNHSLSVKSNDSKPYDGDKATNRQSIYRPFSGMLRTSSSHRRASIESIRTLRSIDRPERKATDPAALDATIEALVSQANVDQPRSPTSRSPTLEPLVAVVPQSNVLREEPQQLVRLHFDMDNIVDDFSFIHKTVLAWDSGAKVKRERHEHERNMRIAANERRVEDLFNDNEIGYADINQLEAEFKQTESVQKAEEEREEVESFVASVFDVVWARINYEMDQLTPLYQEATKLVADASAGKQMFESTDERVPIAPIMDVLLILYQKLMIRHQKAFEAVLERDRRLKKTEVSPWFAIGQIDKVKRIEKRFEDAEKKAILEFCRQRDERANLLMDVLDQHTLRGVGANQDYMESVMQAVRKISIQLAKDPVTSSTSADEVTKAKFITIALSRSSEQIVRTFHIADMLLNAADYEVSVANAKLSNADAAAFRRLREAKAKEDAKLAADLEHRLGLIKGDTARTQEEIAKLMALIGQEDSDLAFDIGRERDKRLVAALNEKAAKKGHGPNLQLPGA